MSIKSSKLKIFLVITILFIGWVLIAPHLARRLIVTRPLERADAIVVLSGSAVYKERTRKAAELYRAGAAPIVFITDDGGHSGWSQTEQRNPPYVELEQRELMANGVPADAIVTLPGRVSGTNDEAEAVKAEIEQRRITSLLVVTSAYHTRRALRTFEKALADKHVETGIFHAEPGGTMADPNSWWLSTLGWQTVGGEYVKSVVYYFYY